MVLSGIRVVATAVLLAYPTPNIEKHPNCGQEATTAATVITNIIEVETARNRAPSMNDGQSDTCGSATLNLSALLGPDEVT